MAEYTSISHPFQPIWQADSRILILGTFPSVRSRTDGFYYGHPQNRFWKVLAALLDAELPTNNEEKTIFLKQNGIALWDVLESCEIRGSSDQSIRSAVPNHFQSIVDGSQIHTIYLNGQKAGALFQKHTKEQMLDLPAIILPSTSPANAAWLLDRLIDAWRVIIG